MAADLTNFLRDEIEPRLFNSGIIKELFPSMGFERRGNKWQSPFKLDGTQPTSGARSDKTIISEQTAQRPRLRIMEHGGESLTLLDYYMREQRMNTSDKESILRAVKELAEKVGVELPQDNFNAAAYKQRQEKQDRLSAIFQEMKKALLETPEGAATLQYLKEQRGYSEEYIKAQDFGYISSSLPFFDELIKLLTYEIKKSDGTAEIKKPFYWKDRNTGETKGIGGTHTFVIAYVSSGEIKGFEFRTILTGEQLQAKGVRSGNKYVSAFISETATQKHNLFGLTGLRLTGNGRKDRNITIVEGELDALRGAYAGIPNVVAMSQGKLTKEQVQQAKERGVREVTLLFDTEELCEGESDTERQKKRAENWRKCADAINVVLSQGLRPYALYLNEDSPEKTDLDSYLKGLEGEALQEKGKEVSRMIYSAEGGFVFLFKKMLKELFLPLPGEERDLSTRREYIRFEDSTIEIANNPLCPETERNAIFEYFSQATNKRITAEEIKAHADRLREIADRERQKGELADALRKANETAASDPRGTINRLKEQLADVETITEAEEFSKYLEIETEAEEDKRRRGKELGILTDFTFKAQKGSETEQLLLPSGALTYICAPTSHGKSRLLENLALQVADKEQEGAVLFFSVEEDADSVQDEFLSIFIGERLSANNLRTIRSERAGDGSNYFEARKRDTYVAKKKEFRQKYIDSGKLRIYYEESRNVDKMQRVIRYLNRELKEGYPERRAIKAVFIDYVQKLKKRGDYKGNRKEELTAVTEDLMSLSIEMGIPFVLAVQLNREALSPLEMDLQNIADASEIEHSGNTILLVWNSNVRERAKSSAYRNRSGGGSKLTQEAQSFEDRTGITLGQPGKLYVLFAKNRKGMRDIETVLDFDGNVGAITQNKQFLAMAASASQKQTASGDGFNDMPAEYEMIKREQRAESDLPFAETETQGDTPF